MATITVLRYPLQVINAMDTDATPIGKAWATNSKSFEKGHSPWRTVRNTSFMHEAS